MSDVLDHFRHPLPFLLKSEIIYARSLVVMTLVAFGYKAAATKVKLSFKLKKCKIAPQYKIQ